MKGLQLIPDFETEANTNELLENIKKCEWSKELSRETLHFGKKYNYYTKTLVDANPIPEWFNDILTKVEVIFKERPTQIIINKYEKGQSIAPHIDHPKLFGAVVASFSIGAEVPMIMTKLGEEMEAIQMPHRSLLVLSHDARYLWKHSLKNNINQTRISITFRTLL
jgi:alkylated DNA repair dioxygenase AlkB